jgi:hypothetical protein
MRPMVWWLTLRSRDLTMGRASVETVDDSPALVLGQFEVAAEAGKPMTFDDMRAVIRQDLDLEDGTKLYPSLERSLRHALHRMVSRGGGLIAIGGGGGRADPYQYFMDPTLIGMASKSAEEGNAWLDALAADPRMKP